MPDMVRSASLDIAISAPVLPADIAATASPDFTRRSRCPSRSSWRGGWPGRLFLARDHILGMNDHGNLGQCRMRGEFRTDRRLVTDEAKLQIGIYVSSASAAPATMTGGPPSPPIASIAIRGAGRAFIVADPTGSGLDGNDFTAIIVAARAAHMMWALQFAAIRAFLECRNRQPIMATAHVTLRGRGFSLWDCHVGTYSNLVKNNNDEHYRRTPTAWLPPSQAARLVASGVAYSDFVPRCKYWRAMLDGHFQRRPGGDRR